MAPHRQFYILNSAVRALFRAPLFAIVMYLGFTAGLVLPMHYAGTLLGAPPYLPLFQNEQLVCFFYKDDALMSYFSGLDDQRLASKSISVKRDVQVFADKGEAVLAATWVDGAYEQMTGRAVEEKSVYILPKLMQALYLCAGDQVTIAGEAYRAYPIEYLSPLDLQMLLKGQDTEQGARYYQCLALLKPDADREAFIAHVSSQSGAGAVYGRQGEARLVYNYPSAQTAGDLQMDRRTDLTLIPLFLLMLLYVLLTIAFFVRYQLQRQRMALANTRFFAGAPAMLGTFLIQTVPLVILSALSSYGILYVYHRVSRTGYTSLQNIPPQVLLFIMPLALLSLAALGISCFRPYRSSSIAALLGEAKE